MTDLTQKEAQEAIAGWVKRIGAVRDMDGWNSEFHPDYMELHPIYPALLNGRDVFNAFQGTRYLEPPRGTRTSFHFGDTTLRAYGQDTILSVSVTQTARCDKDGTISYHLHRSTSVHCKVDGKWVMVHNHSSPPGNDPPWDHNQFATGQLGYTR